MRDCGRQKYVLSGSTKGRQEENLLRLRRSRHAGYSRSNSMSVLTHLWHLMSNGKHTSPTAKNRPFGLIETLVTAFILSRDVQVLPLSVDSPAGDPRYILPFCPDLVDGTARLRESGVTGGVEELL